MNILSLRSAFLFTLLGTTLSASAQTSFYGGDYDGNFVGEFLVENEESNLYYEIRQNVSDENGGDLLYSGLLNATTQYGGEVIEGGVTVFDDYFRVSASVGQGVILEPGTYFLGLAVAPYTYLLTTSHENASGGFIDNDVSYFDSLNYGRPPFESLAETGNQGATDFSMGMTGRPAPVPEPASMIALGLGLMGIMRRRKS